MVEYVLRWIMLVVWFDVSIVNGMWTQLLVLSIDVAAGLDNHLNGFWDTLYDGGESVFVRS